jgi:surface antigen
MKLKSLVMIPALALTLASCTNEEMGALFGATAGALIGSQIGSGHEGTYAAIAGLSLAGAYIGSEIGEDMDERDRYEMERRTQYALERSPSGTTSVWNNPDSGHYGTVTPQAAYQSEGGEYCRPYTQTLNVGGETQTVHGTACRQSDGTWYIVDTGS